jgi:type III secretion system YscD/HrpQ family protein
MFLRGEEGSEKGLIFTFDPSKDSWVFGRDPDLADFVVDDPTVSRKHALFKRTVDGLIVQDLSHTNPVLVNDQEIVEEHLLKDQDKLKLGDSVFSFYKQSLPSMEDKDLPIEETSIESFTESPEEAIEEVISEEKEKQKKTSKKSKKREEKAKEASEEIFEEKLEPKNAEEFLEKAPEQPTLFQVPEEEKTSTEKTYDTIFEDVPDSELPFHMLHEPNLILKVIAGPNSGAEFGMEKSRSYIIGKDPEVCDIIFNDLSVSRQHTKVTIDDQGNIFVEDLGSKNKTLVNSKPIDTSTKISHQDLISLGTTTFLILDREAEVETLYSPVPSFEFRKEESSAAEAASVAAEEKKEKALFWKEKKIPKSHLILGGSLVSVLLLVFLGFVSLFSSQTITPKHTDLTKDLQKILQKYEDVQYSYNPTTESLFLLGHVLSPVDHQELLYSLHQFDQISLVQDKIIIDEYVWKNTNSVLSDEPAWRGVSIHSPKAGNFVMSGYIKNLEQAQNLSDYMNVNFPYVDRLENHVVVEDVLQQQVSSLLLGNGFGNLNFQMANGELILLGRYDENAEAKYQKVLSTFKATEGIRMIKNLAIASNPLEASIDLSDKYQITGYVMHDHKNVSVVANGQIITMGDVLDGMKIIQIEPNTIILEKESLRYKINYIR